MAKVMIFDDDRLFSIMLKKDLEVCGFNVVARFSGSDAVTDIVKNAPDMILMKCDLPVVSGLSIVMEIRKININIPVIFLSSKNDVDEVVNAFEAGGNDYIRRPVELRELLARIKNQLPDIKRKNVKVIHSDYYKINDVSFDFAFNCIREGDKVCQLTKSQTSLMRCLLSNVGQIVPFESVVNVCCNTDEFTVDAMNTMKVILSKLRKGLEEKGITGLRIETYRKKGICLYV